MPDALTLEQAIAILETIPEYRKFLDDQKDWWSTEEVATGLGIGASIVRGWCEKGSIFGAKKYSGAVGWRMPRSGLLIWLARMIQDPSLG